MRLFIAEKPIQAQAIALALGNGTSEEFSIRCGNDVIVWAEGHLYEQAPPPHYHASYDHWRLKDLPIIPERWVWLPIERHEQRLRVIHEFMQQADVIVHACDPDREGQYIGDEIIAKAPPIHAPIVRLWPEGLSATEIQKAIGSMRANEEYRPLTNAAIARAKGDWLWGINFTRKVSCEWRHATGDRSAEFPVGRVKVPTLKLVVDRDAEIAAFVSQTHYLIHAQLTHANGTFATTYVSPQLLHDRAIAERIADTVRGHHGIVSHSDSRDERFSPPLPLNLTELQVIAYKAKRYTGKQTLRAAEALYAKYRIITYPRTSSRYLNERDHQDAPKTLAAIATNLPRLAHACAASNPAYKSSAWNTAKAGAVSSHTAIIPLPTHANLSALSAIEHDVYTLICRFYVAQFLPDSIERERIVTCTIAGHDFHVTERLRLDKGWRMAIPSTATLTPSLPSLTTNDRVTCTHASIEERLTQPPEAYNDATLIAGMRDISTHITDAHLAKQLAEIGIGTDATRAEIVETLIERDKLLERTTDAIHATDKGKLEIAALAPAPHLTSPESTARNEQLLSRIEAGEEAMETFVSRQKDLVRYYCRLYTLPSGLIPGGTADRAAPLQNVV